MPRGTIVAASLSMNAPCRSTRVLRCLLCLVAGVAALCAGIGCRQSAAQAVLVLQPGSTGSTLAGSGADGHPTAGDARLSSLGAPGGMAYDVAGNLLVADTRNHQVLRIDTTGRLTIVAGSGRQGFAGDGGPALAAEWNAPTGIALDAAGDIFVADSGNQRVRRIAAATGVVNTVAGTGSAGYSGDGGSATAARFRSPGSLAVGSAGALYIADVGNHRVRKLQPDGTVVTVAGNGTQGQDGDGGAATAATLDAPSALTLLPDGSLLIADRGAHRLRVVQPDGSIVAWSAGPPGLRRPTGLATGVDGSLYLADSAAHLATQVSMDGSTLLMGSGEQGAFLPGAPLATPLNAPASIAYRTNGDVAVGDTHNHQVQRIALPTLSFGSVPAGSSSQPRTLLLQNGGSAPLTFLALELPSGFAQLASGTTCGTPPFPLPPAAQCSVAITFAPAAQGVADSTARARTLGGAPQFLLLTGTATAGGSLAGSITALRSNGSIAYTGAPVTLTATVAGSLLREPIGTVAFLDGATVVTNMPVANGTATLVTAALPAGAHTLRATYSGDAAYSSSTSPAVALTVVPSPDFTLAAGAASYSGKAGGTITVPMTLLPINGTLNRPVQFAVSGLPAGATATFSPATMVLGGNSAAVTLTLQVPVTLADSSFPASPLAAGTAAALLLATFFRRGRRVTVLLSMFATLLCLSGCGSGFRPGVTLADLTSQTRTYSSVVTATTTGVLGDPLAHSTAVGLVITK